MKSLILLVVLLLFSLAAWAVGNEQLATYAGMTAVALAVSIAASGKDDPPPPPGAAASHTDQGGQPPSSDPASTFTDS